MGEYLNRFAFPHNPMGYVLQCNNVTSSRSNIRSIVEFGCHTCGGPAASWPACAALQFWANNGAFSSPRLCVAAGLSSAPRIPFTIQRLCELLTEPKRNYTGTDKFLRGIEKVSVLFSAFGMISVLFLFMLYLCAQCDLPNVYVLLMFVQKKYRILPESGF